MFQCEYFVDFILTFGLSEVIIEKHYRGLMNRNVCDYLWDEVSKAPSHDEVLPILQTTKYYLIHVQKSGLFFLAVCDLEVPPLLVIEFLYRVSEVFVQYFERLTEGTIRENFVTIYQVKTSFNIKV